MSSIIEISPGKYHYKDWNDIETEVELWNFRGNADENFQCFKVNGKYGIIKDRKTIIADAVYSDIKCKYNRKNGEKYFEYQIDVNHENDYKVYGKILNDGTIVQDVNLHSKYQYDKKYSLIIPKRYIFICYVFGCYYLYYDKFGFYGMLEYDISLQPKVIGALEYGFWNTYNFKSFLFKDKYKPCICFYKEENGTIASANNIECKWFIYSSVSKEGRYIKGYDSIQTVWPIPQKHFWWFKQDDCYGLIDPYLNVILPPEYHINDKDFESIDYIVACSKNGKYGVLQLVECDNHFHECNDGISMNSFFRKFEYKEFLPFEYKEIRRDGDYLILEDFSGFQCVYSIQKREAITDYVFSSDWILFPSKMGDCLIGACLKGHNWWHPSERPNLKNVFLDVNTGDVVIKLEPNIWIKSGFNNGKAYVENTDGDKFVIDKTGKMHKKKSRHLGNVEFEPEEDWNPYWNEYSEEEVDNFYGETDGMSGDLW